MMFHATLYKILTILLLTAMLLVQCSYYCNIAWSRWLRALTVDCAGTPTSSCYHGERDGCGTLWIVGDSAAAVAAAVGGRSGSRIKRSQQTQTSIGQPTFFFLPNLLFSTFFHMVRPFSDRVAPLPLSQHNSPPSSKSHTPIHELILLTSGKCTNPGPPYPCSVVYLRPFNESGLSFKCYGCLSWVHQRWSGLANYTQHQDLWRCSICQTPSPSPPKRIASASFFLYPP